jgi:filamentous hemagglutinin family protein
MRFARRQFNAQDSAMAAIAQAQPWQLPESQGQWLRFWVGLPLLTPLMVVGLSMQAHAQSITPALDGTGTSVIVNGNRYNIGGGQLSRDGANLFHSFNQFNLNAGEVANFVANPSIQTILGRVVGGDASLINGLLQVSGGNANLILVNPAGILFGNHASLNVPAAFTATTATGVEFGGRSPLWSATGSNDYAAMVGVPTELTFAGNATGTIVNAGNLAVPSGQSLRLLGGSVVNVGTLSAPGGQVTIAAVPGNNRVRLSQVGSLLSLEFQPLPTAPAMPTLSPQTLPQLLTGGVASHATGLTVNSQGQVELMGAGIRIPSGAGSVTSAGKIDVSALSGGQVGGGVQLLGDRVALVGTAQIAASGSAGGGTVLLGGDFQGLGSIPTATSTFVSRNATIQADALTQGNGGKVIVWSDQITQFYGSVSAQGGAQAGNGGLVEVSGKQTLTFDGVVDTRAANGVAGTLLLDPATITIVSNAALVDLNGDLTVGDDLMAPTDLDNAALDFAGANSVISSAAIVNLLASGNLTLAADSMINVNDGLTVPATAVLSLLAPTLNLNAPITLAAVGGLTGNASTVNVTPTGLWQNAIDVAAIGATIRATAGTYANIGTIEVNKSLLTLISDTGDYRTSGTFIVGLSQFRLADGVEGVTIQGFRFQNGTNPAGEAFIYVPANANTRNITIRSNQFLNSANSAIATNPTLSFQQNWTIDDNLIDGVTGIDQPAIALANATGISIMNNQIRNVNFSGIALNGVNTATLIDNIITNMGDDGIYLSDSLAPTGAISISNNQITQANLNGAVDRGGIGLDSQGFGLVDFVDIINNTIVDSFNGVAVRHNSVIPADIIRVNNNFFTGNRNAGVYAAIIKNGAGASCVAGAGCLNARNNEWGPPPSDVNPSEPSIFPGSGIVNYPSSAVPLTGTGDAVTANVDFSPAPVLPPPPPTPIPPTPVLPGVPTPQPPNGGGDRPVGDLQVTIYFEGKVRVSDEVDASPNTPSLLCVERDDLNPEWVPEIESLPWCEEKRPDEKQERSTQE